VKQNSIVLVGSEDAKMDESRESCFVCQKHKGEISLPGGALLEDDLIYVGHAWSIEEDEAILLGALIVEPKRHVASWAELSDREAARLGQTIRDVSRALKEGEGAEHIYVFVLGHHVAHLHVWVVPRFPNTPSEYWGFKIFEWPERRVGNWEDVTALCSRLRRKIRLSASA
jgi:diadenosine tetraphosphate (Ap4A) HIT family hydrolase